MTTETKPRTHDLKTWPGPFAAILDGSKPYEIRKADRPFAVGDTLRLREWDPLTQDYTGRETERRVTYLTPGGQWGLPDDLCVMGLVASRASPEADHDEGGCDQCPALNEATTRRASPEAPTVEEGFLLDAVAQALDGKEVSDFARSFTVVADAADLASRCAAAECMRDDRIACVNMLEKEIESLRRASPEEGRLTVSGPDADGLVWVTARAPARTGSISVRADSIAGRAFIDVGILRSPPAPKDPPDGCGGPREIAATRKRPAPLPARLPTAPPPEDSGAREPVDPEEIMP